MKYKVFSVFPFCLRRCWAGVRVVVCAHRQRMCDAWLTANVEKCIPFRGLFLLFFLHRFAIQESWEQTAHKFIYYFQRSIQNRSYFVFVAALFLTQFTQSVFPDGF